MFVILNFMPNKQIITNYNVLTLLFNPQIKNYNKNICRENSHMIILKKKKKAVHVEMNVPCVGPGSNLTFVRINLTPLAHLKRNMFSTIM